MHPVTVLILIIAAVPCLCQRPFYAGLRPIGIPAVSTSSVTVNKRFKEDLPAALKGDVEAANR